MFGTLHGFAAVEPTRRCTGTVRRCRSVVFWEVPPRTMVRGVLSNVCRPGNGACPLHCACCPGRGTIPRGRCFLAPVAGVQSLCVSVSAVNPATRFCWLGTVLRRVCRARHPL